MKRMWSKNELKKIIKTLVESSEWSFEGDVTFNGLATFTDDVEIDADLYVDGAFNVTGNVSIFENIVDKDGHKRFIDGDIETATISGVTFTYAKWSLSGSHLLIVLAGSIENGASLSNTSWVPNLNIPEWIKDKIYPVAGNNIEIKQVPATGVDWSSQLLGVVLQKNVITKVININMYSTLTLTADRGFRIAFDLLIDNE